MIERISPGKTWEGTIFGVFVTFVISFIFKNYFENEFGLLWLSFGFFVPVLATIGDLIESMLKRQAQIKDSGNIMPGHGGVLDRFDSLIFVAPIVFISLNLFKIING
jgi:phosphatidate cytidylyltransferase